MDFLETVVQEADLTYRKMYDGETESPYEEEPEVMDGEEYKKNKNAFHVRLLKENKEFNNAIATVNQTRDERRKKENIMLKAVEKDLKYAIPCSIIMILALVGMIGIMNLVLSERSFSLENIILRETSLTEYDGTHSNYGAIAYLISFILSCLSTIFFIVLCFARGKKGGGAALIVFSGGVVVILFFIIRITIFVVGYLTAKVLIKQWGILFIAAIAFLLLLLISRNLFVKPLKRSWTLGMVCLVLVALGLTFFPQDAYAAAKESYNFHDGKSKETAIELEDGEYMAYDFQANQYKITVEEDTTIIIEMNYEEQLNYSLDWLGFKKYRMKFVVALLNSDGKVIKQEASYKKEGKKVSYKSELNLEYDLKAGNTYYISFRFEEGVFGGVKFAKSTKQLLSVEE